MNTPTTHPTRLTAEGIDGMPVAADGTILASVQPIPEGETVAAAIGTGLTRYMRVGGRRPNRPVLRAAADGYAPLPGDLILTTDAVARMLVTDHNDGGILAHPDGRALTFGEQMIYPRRLRRYNLRPSRVGAPFTPADPYAPAENGARAYVPPSEPPAYLLRMTVSTTVAGPMTEVAVNAGDLIAADRETAHTVWARWQAELIHPTPWAWRRTRV